MNCILTPVSFECLQTMLTDIVHKALESKEQSPTTAKPELLNRKQAARYLDISLTTLNKYKNEGTIKACRLGKKRILFEQADLAEALKRINS